MSATLSGQVVFSSGKTGDYDIWCLDLCSGELTQLTHGAHWNDKPRWSPDGRSVVYVSDQSGTPGIYKMDVVTQKTVALVDNGRWNDFPSFSPDGKQVVYISNEAGSNDVWLCDADGGNRRQLTTYEGNDNFATWMPDGKSIVWSSERGGDADIWQMEVMTCEKRQLNDGKGMDIQPVPSPDGKLISFVSNRSFKDHDDEWRDRDLDIWMMRADGSDVVRITSNQGSDGCVTFSPDGRKLIYASSGAGASGERLRIMDIGELVDAYHSGSDVEKVAGRLRSKQVSLDRTPLENEIGATLERNTIFVALIPDFLLKPIYGTMKFGSERYPHWIAQSPLSAAAEPMAAGAAGR